MSRTRATGEIISSILTSVVHQSRFCSQITESSGTAAALAALEASLFPLTTALELDDFTAADDDAAVSLRFNASLLDVRARLLLGVRVVDDVPVGAVVVEESPCCSMNASSSS
jgi:hypothetical protein